MRLRNKKTGEIKEWQKVGAINYGEMNEVYDAAEYNSLAELNEEWEDVKGPLIKDEKIRKAVRAWAKANDFSVDVTIYTLTAGTRFSVGNYSIEFLGYFMYGLEAGTTCTITELCGEEEEPEDDEDEEDTRDEEY